MGNLRQTSDLDFREGPAQLQRGWLSRNGNGDFEIGARYTWASVRSRFTHIALAFDAGFPTGDARKGLGEAAYTVAPSSLVSRELREGKYQIFSTTGADFVLAYRQLVPPLDERPRHTFFSNSGLSRRTGRGWAAGRNLRNHQPVERRKRHASHSRSLLRT